MVTQRAVNGTTILVLGIASIFLFGVILGPVAWILGNNALAAMGEVGGDPAERSRIYAGRICGMIGTGTGIIAVIWGIFVGGLIILNAITGGH